MEQDEFYVRATRIEIPASITATEFYRKFGYDYKMVLRSWMKNIIIDWRNLRRQDNETFYTFERFFKQEIFQIFELADS